MARRNFLGIKFDDVEMNHIERAARSMGMQKTSYARLMLLNGSLRSQKQSESIDFEALRDDLREIRDALSDLQSSSKESASLFSELLAYLKEHQRVPSFYEFRVRCRVDNIVRRNTETEQQYLHRLATKYYLMYERWPDPSDSLRFGPVPNDFDSRNWSPPR